MVARSLAADFLDLFTSFSKQKRFCMHSVRFTKAVLANFMFITFLAFGS